MRKIGIIWALIASITWGLLYNIDQKLLIKSSPLTMFFIGGIMQIIVLIPYMFTQSGKADIELILSDKTQLGLLFFAEMLCIIAGIAILYAVKNLTAPVASIFEISYPIFVAVFYYLLKNGTLDVKFGVGATFIFIGIIIVMR